MNRITTWIVFFLIVGACSASFGGETGGTTLKEKKIREYVANFIMEKTKNSGKQIRIKRIGYNGMISLPPGEVTYEITAPRQWEGWGKTYLNLVVRVDDRVVKNTGIPVEVEALAEMVVALRQLERGEVIGEGDIALQMRDMATAPGRVCLNPADVIGKKVRVGIRGNSPVRSDYLERVPVVRGGQLVTIVAENGELKITASGRVRASGAEGDLVMVQNLSSKKDVQARVINSETVAVDF